MSSETELLTILKVTDEGSSQTEDIVARESPLTIILNNQELVTLLCTPKDIEYLAIGFLTSEGLLDRKEDVKSVSVDEVRGVVRVVTADDRTLTNELLFKRLITSGCGRGASFYTAADVQNRKKIDSKTQISAEEVSSLIRDFQHHSELFLSTGGVHSAAMCDNKTMLVFNEDIGRHNAVDKIFGECLMKDIPTEGNIIVTSGRISSEILLKVSRGNIPILISKSAPTNLGVRMANDLGVTLIGFARGKRMNVYTNDWRLIRQ